MFSDIFFILSMIVCLFMYDVICYLSIGFVFGCGRLRGVLVLGQLLLEDLQLHHQLGVLEAGVLQVPLQHVVLSLQVGRPRKTNNYYLSKCNPYFIRFMIYIQWFLYTNTRSGVYIMPILYFPTPPPKDSENITFFNLFHLIFAFYLIKSSYFSPNQLKNHIFAK